MHVAQRYILKTRARKARCSVCPAASRPALLVHLKEFESMVSPLEPDRVSEEQQFQAENQKHSQRCLRPPSSSLVHLRSRARTHTVATDRPPGCVVG